MTGAHRQERSAARLAALQALYQLEMTGSGPEEVIEEFIHHRFGLVQADQGFFADVVHGVLKHQVEIDRAVAQSLAKGWTLGRIDSIVRALLRAGGYELVARPDIPAKVIIDEYVGLAHDFFEGEEPSFVNAVLDHLARVKRAGEIGDKQGQ